MLNTKLVRILSTFSKEEFEQLLLFIKSPLYNHSLRPLKVEAILNQLFRSIESWENKKITDENIFKSVFEGEEFNKNKLTRLTSETTKVVRKFIAVHLSNNSSEFNYWHSQATLFRSRGLEKEFEYAIKKAQEFQNESSYRTTNFFLNQFCIESEKVKHSARRNSRRDNLNLPEAISQLDLYFMATKLEYCSYLLIQNIYTNLNPQNSFALFDEVLKTAQSHLSTPIISLFYRACLLLQNLDNGDKYYSPFKEDLEKNKELIDINDLRVFHSFLRNYVGSCYNNGNNQFLSELLSLYKDHINQKTVYQDDGNILDSVFTSAVTAALKLGEFEWAKSFMTKHREIISGKDSSESVYQYNLANYYFSQKKYKEADEILRSINLRVIFFKLAARRMEIKIYYETDSILLSPRINAFSTFLHGLKGNIPDDNHNPNNNFLKIINRIISPSTLKNTKRIESIQSQLNRLRAVAEREWLTEKLQEMI